MAYARTTPLKMLPPLAAFARVRSRQLGLPLSTYLGLLLWNYSQQQEQTKLKPEPAAGAFAREHLPCSVRLEKWGVTPAMLRRSGFTRNALIEALVAGDRGSSTSGFWIKAREP